MPEHRSAVYEVIPTAAIDESSSTLGFANSNMYQLSTSDIDQELELMEQLGVTNVRISIAWASIEAQQGAYNWDAIDYVVNAAAERNMGILGVLSETPAWAGTPYLAGMPDPDVFGQFAHMVATRYEGQISAYEIWNEPNAVNSLDPVDPAAYTTLLQAAYPLIKDVDPTITVIGGVLGSGLSHGNATMNPTAFLTGMYSAGAHGYFDALSFHPYDYTLDFSDGATQVGSPLKQLEQLLSIMAANGDGDLKIWATEYGEPTTSQYSEQQQYDFIQDFLNSWPEIAGAGPMFIYTLRDPDSGSQNQQDNLGVYYTDWTAKQAVQAIIDYIAALPGPTEPVPPSHRIIAAIKAAVQWVGAATRAVVRGAASAVVNIADVVINVSQALAQATAKAVQAVAGAIVAAITAGVQFAGNAVTGVANFVKGVASDVGDAAGNLGVRSVGTPGGPTAATRSSSDATGPNETTDAKTADREPLSPDAGDGAVTDGPESADEETGIETPIADVREPGDAVLVEHGLEPDPVRSRQEAAEELDDADERPSVRTVRPPSAPSTDAERSDNPDTSGSETDPSDAQGSAGDSVPSAA